MDKLAQTDNFQDIVLNDTALIDVRAPVEFEKGAFPNAINLPLMNNEERRVVGIAYKEKGNDAAMELGHKLVSGSVKEQRVQLWHDRVIKNPKALLYCFRGGSRSGISQEWLHDVGVDIVRIKGGYKAFRSYLLSEIDKAPSHFKPIVIGGRTGSGKTLLLKKIQNSIDFEGLANHRGSSFGKQISPQPSQIDFENRVAYNLIQQLHRGFNQLVFEDEGKAVGKLYIPPSLASYLRNAPLYILETSREERVEITFNEYVFEAQMAYAKEYENGVELWRSDMQQSMWRIRKRLGLERYKVLDALFLDALEVQKDANALEGHKVWIEYLLREYYDPMYDYQIQKSADRIVMRGSHEELLVYLKKKNK